MCCYIMCICCFFFFKQKTAYEMRISDWSSDVCSSDLIALLLSAIAIDLRSTAWTAFCGFLFSLAALTSLVSFPFPIVMGFIYWRERLPKQIGRASCRERVCQYV